MMPYSSQISAVCSRGFLCPAHTFMNVIHLIRPHPHIGDKKGLKNHVDSTTIIGHNIGHNNYRLGYARV